jgi:predicted metalloenzyme YecM
MDKIQEIYKKYNRPGAQKLFQLAKNEGLQITLKQVQEFLGGRVEEQQLKETKHLKQHEGHIISYNPFNSLQIDIFVLKKY